MANVFDEPDNTPGKKGDFVTDGQIIQLDEVIEKKNITVEFGDNNVLRKQYVMKNGSTITLPMSLNFRIHELRREYGDKCKTIKVKITGAGKEKRYDALLQL